MIVYDSVDYARSRLVGTCIKHMGTLVKVEDITEEGLAILRGVVTDGTTTHLFTELDVSPLKLGYTNKGNSAYYIMRMPKRNDWKQGTRFEQLFTLSSQGQVPNRSITYKDLAIPALNTYPKLKACFSTIAAGKRERQAFARDFCLSQASSSEVLVEYKGNISIGTFDGVKFHLIKEYQYLKERLEPNES